MKTIQRDFKWNTYKPTLIVSILIGASVSIQAFGHNPSIISPTESNPDLTELRLIQTSPTQKRWMNEDEMNTLSILAHEAGHCGGYMDITDFQDKAINPYHWDWLFVDRNPKHHKWVEPLIQELSSSILSQNVYNLTKFNNRYYQSETGKQAAHYIRDHFYALGKLRSDFSVKLFQHRFKQPSVIAEIKGSGKHADEIVVLGAHLDSVNWKSGGVPVETARAPGADDDASGVATVLEAFRVLASSSFKPDRTIQFMAYAGEERGLLGSQDIAQAYAKEGKKVVAVIQFDMTMYPGRNTEMSIISDYVNAELTTFVTKLLDEYVKAPWKRSSCGYACSDHASWTAAGFPSSYPFETPFSDYNHRIHTKDDLLDYLDEIHGLSFSKLAVAFAVETSME